MHARKPKARSVALLAAFTLLSPLAASSSAAGRTYSLLVDQVGFVEQKGDPAKFYYGPLNSRFEILDENDAEYVVRFSTVAGTSAARLAAFTATFSGQGADPVKPKTVNYSIKKDVMLRYNFQLEYGTD